RERRQSAGEREPRKRPPPRRRVVPDVAGKILVDADLQPVDKLEETPRGRRYQQPDQRSEHEQRAVAPAANERARIRRRRRRRVGHLPGPGTLAPQARDLPPPPPPR